MNKPVSLDAAIRERAREIVSARSRSPFETDPAGNVRRRTKVTKLDIKGPDGRSETEDRYRDAGAATHFTTRLIDLEQATNDFRCPPTAQSLGLMQDDRFGVASDSRHASSST